MDEISKINQEFYDKTFARIYDNFHINSVDYNYSNKLFRKLIKSILNSNRSYKVLDAGCGTGSHAKYFVDLFPNVVLYANDISNQILNVFKEKVNSEKNIVWLNCSAKEALKVDTFDLVCFEGVLHHIHDYEGVIATACMKIFEGGWIIIFNEPSLNSAGNRLIRFMDRLLLKIFAGQFKLRSLKGKILKALILPLHLILSNIYRLLYPEKHSILTNRARGYGFNDVEQNMFILSECHAKHGGVNAQKIIEILNGHGFKITTYSTGPDYCFYLSYLMSRFFGGSHFLLIAQKVY